MRFTRTPDRRPSATVETAAEAPTEIVAILPAEAPLQPNAQGRDATTNVAVAPAIEPAAAPSTNFTTSPVVISGAGSVSTGSSADYSVEVRLPNNAPIPDVTTLWSILPTSAGSASLRVLDSSGRTVRLTRASDGAITLVAKVRYRGKEIVGFSSVIN